jgi:uncharacterized protein (UPF0332 family)
MVLKVETSDRVSIGSLELSKSIAYFCVSQKELENGIKPLAAYSLYYSIFHAAQFRLIIEKKLAFKPKEWIAEKPDVSSLMKWSTPWSHNCVIKKLKKSGIEQDFIDMMEDAKNLREFYSYGPKLVRNTAETISYFVYLSEYQDIAKNIKEMIIKMQEWYIRAPQIIKESLLKEGQAYCFQFAYYLWTGGGQYLKSFEFSPDINSLFKEIVEKIVSTLEKSCSFVMKRNKPLKSV